MPFEFLIPHRLILSHVLLVAIVAGCAALDPWPPRGAAVPQPDVGVPKDPARALDLAKVIEELIVLHNRSRAEGKLASLSASKKLQSAAEGHASDMAARHKMTHTGSDGSTPSSRISASGYRIKRCGENIACGLTTPEEVMKGWMKSPPHKANILGNFSQIGAGCAIAEDGTPFWCVTFGLPARQE